MVLKIEPVNESVWHPILKFWSILTGCWPVLVGFTKPNKWPISVELVGPAGLVQSRECWWGPHPLHFGGARVFVCWDLQERERTREIILSNWRWQSRARVVVENGNIDGWCRTTSLMAKWDDDVDYCLLGRRAWASWNIRTTNQDVEYFHAKMPPIFKLAIIFQLHQKPTVGEIFIDETNAIADCRLNCIFKT